MVLGRWWGDGDGCSFLRVGLGFVGVRDAVIVAFGLGFVLLQESTIVALGLGECGSNGMGKLIAVDLGGTKGWHKGSECIMALLQGGTMMSQTLLKPFLLRDTAYRFFNSITSNSSLSNIPQRPSEIPNSMSATIDSSQAQNCMRNVRPRLGTSHSFEDVPLSPLLDEGRSSDMSSGFFHVPLEHEIIASRSVWDDSAGSDELIDQQSITSTRLSGQGSLNEVDDQSQRSSEAASDPKQDEPSPTSATLSLRSDTAYASDPMTPRTASAVTLVEMPVALDTIPGPNITVKEGSFSSQSPRDQSWGSSLSRSDISESSEYSDRSTGPADPTTSIASVKVVAHATFPRVERPESPTPSSFPAFFEIPIPIFPFPAGTTRCNNRNCPLKHRHEQGPYLHGGKLRSREGSVFGSSNPPPEIWFLYDMSRDENLHGTGNEAFAPVELFVRYHFGETGGEYVRGCGEVGGHVRRGEKQGGKKSRFWRFWG